MRAFVTGGSGFLGRHLIPYLKSRGVEVVALARSPSSSATVEKLGATAAVGDLADGAALANGMKGCDVVIHAAASTQEWGPYREFEEANVRGTERVVSAAKTAGVRRVVHVSTEAVLMDGAPIRNVDETRAIPKKPIGAYARSKAAAERAALAGAVNGLEVVVVRPRLIWGKGDTTVLPKLVEAAKKGRFAWIGGGNDVTSTCHVENVCEGILLAAQRGRSGEVYFLTDGAPVQWREFLSELVRTQGVEIKAGSMPYGVAFALAGLLEAVWRVLPLKSAPPLQRMTVLLMGREISVNDAKARRELGYVGHKSRDAGFAELRA